MFVLVSKSTLDNLVSYSFSDHTSRMVKSLELIGSKGNQSRSELVGQGSGLGRLPSKHRSYPSDAHELMCGGTQNKIS